MRRYANVVLTWASVFLIVMAVMLNAAPLFYMATALVTTLIAARMQAWRSVQGLRIERANSHQVDVGDPVLVQWTVWAEGNHRRPLVSFLDALPSRLAVSDVSPTLPIAPICDVPIRTQYRFTPHKRGRFRWTGVRAIGTDALGLVTMSKAYPTEPTELTVLPRPIPVQFDQPTAAGWGYSEVDGGHSRGAGIDPRGIREYSQGDPMRYVHWRSSARGRTLMVKEFETGSYAQVGFVFQRKRGTDLAKGPQSSLDLMCGHAVHMAGLMISVGSQVTFPQLEADSAHTVGKARLDSIRELLAEVQADQDTDIASDAMRSMRQLPSGSSMYLFVAVQDPELPGVVRQLHGRRIDIHVMLYDANLFGSSQIKNAADPSYAAELVASGARVRRISEDIA